MLFFFVFKFKRCHYLSGEIKYTPVLRAGRPDCVHISLCLQVELGILSDKKAFRAVCHHGNYYYMQRHGL